MNSFVVARPLFWKALIVKIKADYKGKITYGENWDTYKTVPFIASLDYIGIDAYFPLNTAKTPTIKALETAWQSLKKEMQLLSKKYNKKILFTEYGYQSKDFAGLEPWDHSKSRTVNLVAQPIRCQHFTINFGRQIGLQVAFYGNGMITIMNQVEMTIVIIQFRINHLKKL